MPPDLMIDAQPRHHRWPWPAAAVRRSVPLPALLAALVLFTLTPAPARAAEPSPLGLTCRAQPNQVRLCQGNGTTDRVPSFDGVPLDVDVTLPPTGEGPFPTIVMLHGWGNDKTAFLATGDQGAGYNAGAGPYPPVTYRYNNDFYARQGYAVLTYSARGKGKSCGGGGGAQAKLQTGACARGFIRLADQRYEIRDTQHLLGLLVDQGISQAGALGVTGISYGGGQSLQLAYLKDRIRCPGGSPSGDPCAGKPNGAFVPWTSPAGVKLSITASHPRWFWSDLVSSLLPNGRLLDHAPSTHGLSREPLGVVIASFFNGLYATGDLGGYIVAPQPPGSPDAPWDLTAYAAAFNAGEPYGQSARTIADEIAAYHQAYGIPGGPPAPLLLENGWNDALFPVSEAIRVYDDIRSRFPTAQVELLVGDVGHSRASNKREVNEAFNARTAEFFATHLKGQRAGPPTGRVTAYLTSCPASATDGGPITAANWGQAHPGAVVVGSAQAQAVLSTGGSPATSAQFDPIAGSDTCRSVPAVNEPGTAVYAETSQGFTLLGRPRVTATVSVTGANGQLVGRLWDVSPDGRQVLVTRGVYRLLDDQQATISFELGGNGYRFAPGNTAKLELLGSDPPYYRPSNGAFAVQVSGLQVVLPVADEPGATSQVVSDPFAGATGDVAPPGKPSQAPPAAGPAAAGRSLPATGPSQLPVTALPVTALLCLLIGWKLRRRFG